MSEEDVEEVEKPPSNNSEDSDDDVKEIETEIIDSRLYGSLESYFEGIIEILEGLANSDLGQGPYYDESLLNIEMDKSDGMHINTRDAWKLSHALTTAWSSFPGFSDCLNSFKESDVYSDEIVRARERGKIDDFEDHPELIKEEALPKILNRYLTLNETLDFDKETFERCYSEFENYLTKDTIKFRSIGILTDFEMGDDEIELENDLTIRQLDDDEIPSTPPTRRRRNESGPVYCIDQKHEINKFGEEVIEQAKSTFDKVILVLRLFSNKGDVDYSISKSNPISEFVGRQRTTRMGMGTSFFRSKYVLSENECDEFSQFWADLASQIEDPADNYRVSIDKFSTSFNRSNENDLLLDCVIALEALYLKSGEFQEMSYRLSQRGALLLGDNKSDALEIKKDLKDAYDLRSRLVHGSTADVDEEFVYRLHELTRESLATFLKDVNDGKNHEELISELDEKASAPLG